MPRIPGDKFRIFISHKHRDADLARAVLETLEGLAPDRIECFASSQDLVPGRDWRKTIFEELGASHMLLLLFTYPADDWDWCLYESGLYTGFDETDVKAVVCLFDPDIGPPDPLSRLQGVRAEHDHIECWLARMCRETWEVSDDWRTGALHPEADEADISAAAAAIVDAFETEMRKWQGSAGDRYYPCHRLVLDLEGLDLDHGIPEAARVCNEYGRPLDSTLKIFGATPGCPDTTWGSLLEGVSDSGSLWREELDDRFRRALRSKVFRRPVTAPLYSPAGADVHEIFKPILYRIQYDRAGPGRKAIGLTLVFEKMMAPERVGGEVFNLVRINARFRSEVFERYLGKIAAPGQSESDQKTLMDRLRRAYQLVKYEAHEYDVFASWRIKEIYGSQYTAQGIPGLVGEWADAERRLYEALDDHDAEGVEKALHELSELNRTFSIKATERYLEELAA